MECCDKICSFIYEFVRLKQITLVISAVRIEPHRLSTVNYRTHSRATVQLEIRLPSHASNGAHTLRHRVQIRL